MAGPPEMEGTWIYFVETVYGAWLHGNARGFRTRHYREHVEGVPSVGLTVQTACIWEATARKPGNVHPFADFGDCRYVDFLLSAAAIAPVLEKAPERSVGETILQAVQATRQVTASNTNLGIILLLSPLSTVPADLDLRAGLLRVLDDLDVADARAAYEAIRLAEPGGLGQAADQDIRLEPTGTLRQVMELAADRDLIARQYANGFREVFEEGLPALERGLEMHKSLEGAILYCFLTWLANHPDSLIVRKCGISLAEEAGRRARAVLKLPGPFRKSSLTELDAWLRADGNRRNPGTSADLTAACLFLALRSGKLTVPCSIAWAADIC
jgi:triphosphoribosyl-dephospho-CoA synthase